MVDPFGIDAVKMEALAKPFELSELEWRAISWNKEGNAAIAYAYVNPRAVKDRLDEVFGGEWSVVTEVISPSEFKAVVRATITINGISRSGFGEASIIYKQNSDGGRYVVQEPYKSAESDAIKRAAEQFGVARYLYRLPAVWIAWEGDKEWGHFAVDPASVVFADGQVSEAAIAKDTKGGRRGRPAGSGKKASPPAAAPSGMGQQTNAVMPPAPVAAPSPTPVAASAPAAVAPPAAVPAAGRKPEELGIDPIQIAWIEGIYVAAGMAPPADLATWQRKQAAEHMREAIVAGGNTNPLTSNQLEIMSKLYNKGGGDFPADLTQLTVQTASPYISQLIAASKQQPAN